jgi:sec-independent protein translocase protein TatB
MLGVGWTEMLVIGVVALIVIGPKDLPQVMNRIGKFAGSVRRMGADFQRELNKTTGLNEIKNLRQAVTAPLKATTDAIRKEFNTIAEDGKVEPSGALKPADPKVESVVSAIEAKAGIAQPATGAMPAKAVVPPKADAAAAPTRPATARRPAKPKAAANGAAPVASSAAAAAKPKAKARPAAAKPAEAGPGPGPVASAKPRAPARRRTGASGDTSKNA